MSRILVYNEETGAERLMGELQFKNWGEKNGFKPVPNNKMSKGKDVSNESTETAGETTDATDETDTSNEEPRKNVVETIEEIKEIFNSDIETEQKEIQIETFRIGETRSTVLKAIDKFGKQKTEEDA